MKSRARPRNTLEEVRRGAIEREVDWKTTNKSEITQDRKKRSDVWTTQLRHKTNSTTPLQRAAIERCEHTQKIAYIKIVKNTRVQLCIILKQ